MSWITYVELLDFWSKNSTLSLVKTDLSEEYWTLKYSFCSGEVKYGLFILYWPYSQYQIGKGGRLSNSWVDGCRCSAWLLLRFCPFPMGIVCSHPIPISNCANTYAPTISSLPSYIGNGIASYFRQTGDVHLVIGSNKHWCQPLDGCSPFAEKNSLFRCLFIYLPLLKRIRGVPIPTFFLWLLLLILLQLEKLFGASPPPNVNSQMLLL